MKPNIIQIICYSVLFSTYLTEKQPEPARFTALNACTSKTTCQDCIQTSGCAWCNTQNFTGGTRCFQPSVPTLLSCPEEDIFNPDNEVKIQSNLALSRPPSKAGRGNLASGSSFESIQESYHSESSSSHFESSGGSYGSISSSGQNIVQVAPQRMNLRLRARQTISINMSYTQAEDYPVDLYYLMDLSKSMSDDKDKLSELGDQLAQTMANITSKFKLGYGSFVDKVLMPYVSTIPEKLRHPCMYYDENSGSRREVHCVAPYGFRHHLNLSTDIYQFAQMVKKAQVSGNLDGPEGGFDAIMQSIACRNEIGWREQARRLLVFSSDAGFHYAGDGKLGGVVKPNDGYCHMSTDNYYSMSSFQDYPSIEQINLAVKKNSINIIFAVTENIIKTYEQLAKHIEGSYAGVLKNDSSNIVELIKEQYEQISSTVDMKHNATSDISIRFFTKCLNTTGPMVNTNKCGNIKVGDVIDFRIELEILKCPADSKNRFQTIQIYPVGINESLVIDLEMLCECECEKEGDKHFKINAPFCHNHGTYRCGVCQCNPGAFGRKCECNADEVPKLPTNGTGCVHPNSTLGVECAGRGSCICGRCECEQRGDPSERIYGDFCECDNFSCDRHLGMLCSGEKHGICDCGICRCETGWEGEDCSCQQSNSTCYDRDSTEICSGHGTCECGVCKCDKEGHYSGRFCEKCPTCPDQCLDFKDCVQCQQYQTGPLKDVETCGKNCTFMPVPEPVDKVETIETNTEYLCRYTDDDHCQFKYVYYYDSERNLHIRAQEKRTCPPQVFVLGIVFGVIAAIVLIGLAILLLWKLLTTIHDRREFAKFEKERMMAKWDTGENPIYKQATSTFKNPTYAGKH